MPAARLLIVDDDEALAATLRKTVTLEGYSATVRGTAAAALEALEAEPQAFDLALLDLRLPDLDGLDLLARLKALREDLPCVVLTAFGTVQTAVEAMRRGAFDFLLKPFPREKLLAAIDRGLERARLVRENRALKAQLRNARGRPGEPQTRSPAYARVLDMIRQVAPTEATVLLTGETGTGKERGASFVHEWSQRRDGPFLTVNCAALAESLLESQLFGHVRGAFTGADEARKGLFEEAGGGTIFLDEIGDVSAALQVKLLRVLQEREFLPVGATRPQKTDVRVVAATNRDLRAEVAAGRFREDLFYRLAVFTVQMPALRERREDLEALAEGFVAEAVLRVEKEVAGLTPEALEACRAYAWPGNVRELRNVVERAVILCREGRIGPELLGLPASGRPAEAAGAPFLPSEPLALWQVEKAYIAEVLRRTREGKSAAARILGISRKTLDRKIREYRLLPAGEVP